jgi:hypothetical protein
MAVLFALFPLTSFPLFAVAQNMQWGSGQWGGSQGCSYQQQTGSGAVSEDDPLQEMLAEIQEIKQQIKDKKSELKKNDRQSERYHSQLEEGLSPEASALVFSHIENNTACTEYQGLANTAQQDSGSQGDQPIQGAHDNMLQVQGMSAAEWSKHCDRSKSGSVRETICSKPEAKSCRKALVEYRKSYTTSKKLASEIESLQNSLESQKSELADLKKDLREEAREARTQGDYCEECAKRGNGNGNSYQQPQTNWGSVLANVGTGVLASYMGYKSNKMISETNADLGFPTYNSNYSALGYGMPYFQAGLYGAISGGQGQGGFGCGGNSNMAGGAFGYPSNMMGGSMGGGMFMGNPSMMMGMNGMGGMGNGMMSGMGMMNGMMGNGMMSSGMMMNGGFGMMSNGMMSSGMMNSGMMMNNGMMMSGNLGMMTGMGMMMGYGSMMDSSSLALQQQLMQQQSSKYSAMSSLQSELYSLMARIQQVQYGGSSYLGTGLTSSYANGVLPAPTSAYYGSSYGTTTSSGVLPAPGTTSSSTYYGR